MTPFSTDRVSLGRPAICGNPDAMLVQGFYISLGGWDISYSHYLLAIPRRAERRHP